MDQHTSMQVKTIRQGIPISVIMQMHGQVAGKTPKNQVTPRAAARALEMRTNTQGKRPTIKSRSNKTKKSHIHAHTGKIINVKGQTNIERIRKQQKIKEVIKKLGHAIQTPTMKKLAVP